MISSPLPLNHHKLKRDLGKPAFDLADINRRVRKCIATGNEGTLDYLIENVRVDDHGIYFKHEGDTNTGRQTP